MNIGVINNEGFNSVYASQSPMGKKRAFPKGQELMVFLIMKSLVKKPNETSSTSHGNKIDTIA
jgi:hypothetical protein